ncbi:hypothetical protein DK419_13270 [Methylobacterium terrae]|uniref:Uncharacterized protein n=1 Tax=Methylobacterium terrae TaxID=2202827 RepID=A0A2U8WLY2_9HYPH|nr:hypothetical protein [Methylobacterium terrae]AWN47167.1 hypothetical protein DK419_13270 [Methylobacterium terrae]
MSRHHSAAARQHEDAPRSALSRRPFDETKVRRGFHGRFGEKPDLDGEVKVAGINRNDVIDSLSETSDKLHGRRLGDILDAADDEEAVLRNLVARHKRGEIQFREGGGKGEAVDLPGYLGKPYQPGTEEIFHQGDMDDDAFEDLLERQSGKIGSSQIVMQAQLHFTRSGKLDVDSLIDDLSLSMHGHRNQPVFMRGELGEIEQTAVRDAITAHVEANARYFDKADQGATYLISLQRPDDAPYWKARASAETAFRRQGLSERDIEREMDGSAEEARDKVRAEAAAAARNKTYGGTNDALKARFPAEFAAMEHLQNRELFIARSKLLKRYQTETGEELPYM